MRVNRAVISTAVIRCIFYSGFDNVERLMALNDMGERWFSCVVRTLICMLSVCVHVRYRNAMF